MAFILTDRDEYIANWACKQIPHVESAEDLEPYKAVGVMTGNGPDDTLMAAVVYHMWVPSYRTCQVTVASVDPRWASKSTIRALLSVPFLQYNCNKVWLAVPHTNERVAKFCNAIGFKREAVLKDHFGPGTHAVILRMLKQDYKRKYIPKEWREAA